MSCMKRIWPRNILFMGAVYRFSSYRDWKGWALDSCAGRGIQDPCEYGAREICTVCRVDDERDVFSMCKDAGLTPVGAGKTG